MVLKSKAATKKKADVKVKVEDQAKVEDDVKVETSTQEPETTTESAVTTDKAEPADVPAVSNIPKVSAYCKHPAILEAVAGAKYGTFTSIVASNGNFMVSGKDTILGNKIKFQSIIQKLVWKVVPGSNDDEAKDYFKVSYDGETTTDGDSIEDAILAAKEAGYDDADVKEYIDVICYVVECENKDFIGETVTLQLAPSSQYTWKPLEGKCKMGAVLGTLKAEPFAGNPELGKVVVITGVATPTTWNKQNFTKMEFKL